MPEYTHKKFGKCKLIEITQKQFVDYSNSMLGKENMTLVEWRGESVKMAIKTGFFIEPILTDEDIDEASPGYIRWLSDECITEMIKEANDIDPLS